MRKIALLLAIPIIAVILSSCTFVTTRVKDSYIQKEYIDKVKVPEKYKVGTKEIKFYVDKVVDSRKTKHVWRKQLYGMPVGAPIKISNVPETVKNVTIRALKNTGWGIGNKKEKSDFFVTVDLKELEDKWGLLLHGWSVSKTTICVKNKKGETIIRKDISYKDATPFAQVDLTMRFRGFVGLAVRTLYKSLLEFFSSPEFVNAIKEDYYNTHSVKQERAE